MILSEHFYVDEFTRSDKAASLGIDNRLPDELFNSACKTAEMLEHIRDALLLASGRTCPIKLNSGYRCLSLNRALGSKDTSDHLKAAAADFVSPAFGTPKEICELLVPQMSVLGIGQIIYEKTWVHVSRITPANSANRVLTLTKQGGYAPGITDQ